MKVFRALELEAARLAREGKPRPHSGNHHERTVCRCGEIMSTCRCPAPKVDVVSPEPCMHPADWSQAGTFGSVVHYGSRWPEGDDLVLLCELGRYGLKPVRVLLPHQIYAEDLDQKKEYVAYPLRSAECIRLGPVPEPS